MTICIDAAYEQAKFFKRCLYRETKGCKDLTYPNFDEVNFMFGFPTIEVKTGKSVEEVENLLKENKVKYLWVNQY